MWGGTRSNGTTTPEPNGHLQKLTELHEELKTVEHDFNVFTNCPVSNFCRSVIDTLPAADREQLHTRLNEILAKECEQHFDVTADDSGPTIS